MCTVGVENGLLKYGTSLRTNIERIEEGLAHSSWTEQKKYVICAVTGAQRCKSYVYGQRAVEGVCERFKLRDACLKFDLEYF